MKRARVLHRHQRVAFEHEARHAHQHGEDIVVERLWWIGEETTPDVGAGAKPECARRIESRRENRLYQPAALKAKYTPFSVTAQRHRQREPVADHRHLWIGIETFLKVRQPGFVEHGLWALGFGLWATGESHAARS